MQMIRMTAGLLGVLLISPPAFAGWQATQVGRGGPPGSPPKDMKAEIFYDNGLLRLDQEGAPSVIFRMREGRMIILDHQRKAYMDESIEERIQERDKMVAMLKAQRDQIPPEMKARFEEQLKMLEGGNEAAKPASTGKKSKVGKFACEIYAWKSDLSEGQMCLAKKVGVDLGDFAKDSLEFGKLVSKLGGGAPGSTALLEMASKGFPVRITQRMRMSKEQPWVETSSEITAITATKVDKTRFAVPKDYTKASLPKIPQGAPPPPPAAGGVTKPR